MKKRLAILGSTGSVGCQIVDVIENFYREFFQVDLLVAHSNVKLMMDQARRLQIKNVALTNHEIKFEHCGDIELFIGFDRIYHILAEQDLVFVACSGIEVLEVLYKLLKDDVKIALANKEVVVCCGDLLKQYSKNIFPLDSEHFAIWQLLQNKNILDVEKITLTATGGPFFGEKKENITVQKALNHPVWSMGKKISIDSATMMNKVLEVIEAHYLFNFPKERIEILIHPEAIVHGFVQLKNGTEEALLYPPDMRVGIKDVLAKNTGVAQNGSVHIESSFAKNRSLNFHQPNVEEFPALQFLQTDQYITLSAANDVAVSAFSEEKIAFENIVKIIFKTLERYSYSLHSMKNIGDIVETHHEAKHIASQFV